MTYNVFLDVLIEPENYTENYKLSSYVPPYPLTPGATYFWKVIPIANTEQGKIQGKCESRIWSFSIETGSVHIYGVDLEFETSNLTVKQGEYVSINITVTNTGNAVDMINLDLDKGILDANVALEHEGTPLRLNINESMKLKLEILVSESTKAQNYTISITAISNGALSENQDISVEKSLQLNVIEKEILEEKDQEEADLILWISILIILIILILAITLFIYKKKKKSKIPVLKAELLTKSPKLFSLPGATTPSGKQAQDELPISTDQVQPQVADGKMPAPSLGPIPAQPQLQLPSGTLSKAQKLALLDERLLRGEISEETYKELKARIEAPSEDEVIVEDIDEEQPSTQRPVTMPSKPQEIPPEPEISTQPSQPQIEEVKDQPQEKQPLNEQQPEVEEQKQIEKQTEQQTEEE